MANNPVIGLYRCPKCKRDNVVLWDGNVKTVCMNCGSKFTIKRQKMRKTEPLRR